VHQPSLLEQPALDHVFSPASFRRGLNNQLNRLFNKVQTRTISGGDSPFYTDWFSREVTVTVVRPLDAIAIPPAGSASAPLGKQVTLQPHASLQGKARLITAAQGDRDLSDSPLPALLRDYPDQTGPLEFDTPYGNRSALSTLELFSLNDYHLVTPENPLVLLVDRLAGTDSTFSPQSDEYILPIAFDTECGCFLPLGRARLEETHLRIELQRLPAPASLPVVGERTLTGSIRIFFQKILYQYHGYQYRYPQLAQACIESGRVRYNRTLDEIRASVAEAERILLYIHGIIGDTSSMVGDSHPRILDRKSVPHYLAERYDVMLTFDYENLNTSIEENARSLKERLLEIGIQPNHGKQVDIVAHSMGGLVSRWFIEREGGNLLITRLIMLGTPNNGSPWPQIESLLTTFLAIGLNGLLKTLWTLEDAGRVVHLLAQIEVTLNEMHAGSEFLSTLQQRVAPH
jgi:pimeloyl-ACP methyl ester carboxylesterase